jgi:hypothetical protein
MSTCYKALGGTPSYTRRMLHPGHTQPRCVKVPLKCIRINNDMAAHLCGAKDPCVSWDAASGRAHQKECRTKHEPRHQTKPQPNTT